jgi:hypothetical protein
MAVDFKQLVGLARASYDKNAKTFNVAVSAFESSNISRLFGAFLPGGDFALLQAELDDTRPDKVIVSGKLAQPLLSTPGLSVVAEFSVVNSAAEVLLTAEGFPAGWKLSDSLPSLLGGEADSLIFTGAKFTLDSLNRDALGKNFQTAFGYPATPGALDAGVQGGLSFSSRIQLDNSLGELA